jgi:hypothetical protein
MSKETDVNRCFLDIVDVLKNDVISKFVSLKSIESTGINDENIDLIVNTVVESAEKAKDFGVNQLTNTMRT